MSETKAPWSPARAVLPPDPNGHNRALDRVAAEHLREVAPHLAPKEETGATQARPDASGYPYFCDERPTLPAPPQPEPTKADVPRKGSKAWAIQEACRIVGIAFHGIAEYDEASDCFCSEGPSQDYRNGGRALAFVEAAVREKLAREKAPAPTAEAKGMSREEFAKHGSAMLLLVLQDARPRYDEFVRHFNAIAECDAALRTRASEAEERAEMYVRMHRQECIDGAARLMAAFRERDETREQRDAAQGLLSEALCNLGTARGDLAAANARAEEAERNYDRLRDISLCRLQFPDGTVPGGTEECARGWHQWYGAADARAESLRARLAAAEAEVKRLTALSPPHTVALRLDEINAAFDGPIPTAWPKDVTGSVVSRIAALRERAERLVRAGDDMAALLPAYSELLARWAAAKGTK